MPTLVSEGCLLRILSLSKEKKLAFLLLLFDRMVPQLRSFCHAESLDFRIFQKAREEFWQLLRSGNSPVSWHQLREDILGASPDSENFGSLAASYALNAALVAADIAGFIEDEEDQHLVEAMGYARDSLDAFAISEIGAAFSDRQIGDFVSGHPLMLKEKRVELEDVLFLSSIEDPWADGVDAMLRDRAKMQSGLLRNT